MGTNAYYLNQFISTTLATVGGIDDSQTTGIILTSVTGVETTKPGIVCLSYSDPIDTSKAEWISYTSISVTNELQGVTRGAEGFSAKSHSNGATIAFPISESHINNLNDALIIDGAETNLVTGVISPSGTSSDSSTELVTKSYADGGLKDSLYRQAIINGNFDVWQRTTNVSLAPSIAVFAADRWSCYSNHADYSFSRQDANLSGSQYCGRYQRASGSIGTNAMHMFYAGIEKSDAIKFRGKKLTLSFYAKKGANFSPSTFTAEIRTGTVGDENVWSMTNSTIIATLSPTLTTDWQKFTLTTSSVIASNVSEITIKFYTSACAGTAGAADYFDITQVQLCEGEVALPFMPKSYEEELRACQRYCLVFETTGTYETLGIGVASSTAETNIYLPFPVSMRTLPALSATASDWYAWDGLNVIALTSINLRPNHISKLNTVLQCRVESGLTQYRSYMIIAQDSAGKKITLEAEL